MVVTSRKFRNMVKKIPDIKSTLVSVGVGAKVDPQSIKSLKKNFDGINTIITTSIARAIASIGVDILSNAQPRVPIDTGKLRKSGISTLHFDKSYMIIGRGREDGTVMANLRYVKAKLPSKKISTSVFYHRFSDTNEDFDVALWCHEILNPHDQRANRVEGESYAITPGTGPKYLEIPFVEKYDRYVKFVKNLASNKVLDNVIEKAKHVVEGTRTKYKVDRVDIILSRIEDFGYFGSFGKGKGMI